MKCPECGNECSKKDMNCPKCNKPLYGSDLQDLYRPKTETIDLSQEKDGNDSKKAFDPSRSQIGIKQPKLNYQAIPSAASSVVDLRISSPDLPPSPFVARRGDMVERPFYGYSNTLTRIAAFLIDMVVLLIPFLILLLTISLTVGWANKEYSEVEVDTTRTLITYNLGGVLFIIGCFVLYIAYNVYLEASYRRGSLGKIFLQMQVTDIHGDQLSLSGALSRNIMKLVSTCFCMLGFLLALFTSKQQALHDIFANTLITKR